jgi:SpoIID/LytB domain protein
MRWLLHIVHALAVALVFPGYCYAVADPDWDTQRIVRVAIGDNQLKNFLRSEVEIIAPCGCRILRENSSIPLAKIPRSGSVVIKLDGENFSIASGKNIHLENVAGPIVVENSGILGIKGLMRFNQQALYRGNFEIVRSDSGGFFVINAVPLEEYLRGVILSEMRAKFAPDALKAQAIAARNYASIELLKKFPECDLLDSSANQVYAGVTNQLPKGNAAVESTEGLVAMCGGNLILPLYFSTSCGHTENCENVFSAPLTHAFPGIRSRYLVGRPDGANIGDLSNEDVARKFYKSRPKLYDSASPYFRWVRKWKANELEEILRRTLLDASLSDFIRVDRSGGEFGKIRQINVKKRGVSGKIMEMEVVTSEKTFTVAKDAIIRRVFEKNGKPLPSANVAFEVATDWRGNVKCICAYGGGFGHGVGMSQYGANFMATRLRKKFDQILKKYYGDDISIATIPLAVPVCCCRKSVGQYFYAPSKHATLVVASDGKIPQLEAKINGVPVHFQLNAGGKPETSRIDASKHLRNGRNCAEFSCPTGRGDGKPLRLYFEFH